MRVCAGGARQLASLPRLEVMIEEMFCRTEADLKITSEPWSSMQSLTEQPRPLFGVDGVVCPKKEKREQKKSKKVLTRGGMVIALGKAWKRSEQPTKLRI